MAKKKSGKPGSPGRSNKTIEAACLAFLRAAIDKDRRERGAPRNEEFTALEMANAAATLAGLLLAAVPFGARWQLLGVLSKLQLEAGHR